MLHPVVGHGEACASLARAHANGGLPAAMLFHGVRGVGKQRMALWTAQLRVCEAPTPDGPCGDCKGCRLALKLEHPDIHWYCPLPRPKGVSGDKLVDALEAARYELLTDLREQPLRPSPSDELRGLYLGTVQALRRRAYLRPTMAPIQVFIIGDAEFLVPQEASPEAANALLKLLEEPPDGTCFVLTSGEPGRLLATIRSRSVPLHLTPLPRGEVESFLAEHTEHDAKTAAWAAGMAQGSIGRALGFLPEGEGHGPLEAFRRKAFRLVQAALADDLGSGFSAALSYSPAGARSLVELFAFVEEWLRDLAAVAAGAEDEVISQDAVEHLRKLVEKNHLEAADVSLTLPLVEDARQLARGNVNPQLLVSNLVRRLRQALRPVRPSPTEVV